MMGLSTIDNSMLVTKANSDINDDKDGSDTIHSSDIEHDEEEKMELLVDDNDGNHDVPLTNQTIKHQ